MTVRFDILYNTLFNLQMKFQKEKNGRTNKS